ncbi:MAG TPA: hypothetical protein VGP95_18840 [Gemmatimonadaceae bacterium]|nr:hypothetical protein [Gemmatimonadaceae bacterium]
MSKELSFRDLSPDDSHGPAMPIAPSESSTREGEAARQARGGPVV